MNVFILDKNMEKSAQMLDDAHLRAQINEAAQILMANYNRKKYPDAKIGHINHPVTVFYSNPDGVYELFHYLDELLEEYFIRFGKQHQNAFWWSGFYPETLSLDRIDDEFRYSKTYVNGVMTNSIEEIREYIMNKPHKRALKWTNRDKPNWWRNEIDD